LRERGKAQGLVLAADTIVERQGEIIGQPRDADDARRILFVLRDVRHAVITAVALLDLGTDECILFADTAHVEVGHIADEQIEEYIAGGAWRGKAGAYNLSERLEAGWPIRYEGDPGTIMGLPMRRLAPLLRRWVA
jgi:septum formation protein